MFGVIKIPTTAKNLYKSRSYFPKFNIRGDFSLPSCVRSYIFLSNKSRLWVLISQLQAYVDIAVEWNFEVPVSGTVGLL